MAVSSKKNNNKKSLQNIIDDTNKVLDDSFGIDNNVNDTTPKDKIDVVEDIINEEVLSNNISVSNTGKNKYIFIFGFLVLLITLGYILLPKIKLNGDKIITINYKQSYTEPGYKASFIFKNITNDINVNDNLIDGKVGSYEVDYTYKIGFITIKKNRIVNIIDDKEPEVVIGDDITICPNDDISNIKYEVIDEYDGDITSKAISEYLDNKLIITVSDNANNKTVKEVNIKREDLDKPVIKLKGDETVYLRYGSKYYEPGYEAIDNCDGGITDKVVIDGTVGNDVGTYKVNYSVSDEAGNISEVTRTVIIRNNYLYNSGTISNGTIYFTFDDGPSNGITNVILDILKEEDVKATFFVTCKGPDSLIKRMYDEGHTVALHTATHEYSYIYSSVNNYFDDLNKVSTRVKNIIDEDAKIIRFPGGSSNTISRNYKSGIMSELTWMVLDKGYRYFDWNVDSKDAGGAWTSGEVYNNVINNLSKSRSNVVLMHDIKTATRDALRNIIKYGKDNGYSFDKLTMDTYMIRHGVNN